MDSSKPSCSDASDGPNSQGLRAQIIRATSPDNLDPSRADRLMELGPEAVPIFIDVFDNATQSDGSEVVICDQGMLAVALVSHASTGNEIAAAFLRRIASGQVCLHSHGGQRAVRLAREFTDSERTKPPRGMDRNISLCNRCGRFAPVLSMLVAVRCVVERCRLTPEGVHWGMRSTVENEVEWRIGICDECSRAAAKEGYLKIRKTYQSLFWISIGFVAGPWMLSYLVSGDALAFAPFAMGLSGFFGILLSVSILEVVTSSRRLLLLRQGTPRLSESFKWHVLRTEGERIAEKQSTDIRFNNMGEIISSPPSDLLFPLPLPRVFGPDEDDRWCVHSLRWDIARSDNRTSERGLTMKLRELFRSLTLPRRDLSELVSLVEQDNTAALENTAPACFSQRRADGKVLAHAICDLGRHHALGVVARVSPHTLEVRDNNGTTPAWLAAKNGHAECLRICARTAPHSLAMRDGGLPLAHAPALHGNAACLRVIAEYAPEILTEQWNEDGATPAMYAAHSGHAECLRIISEAAPATLAIPNKKGFTPDRIARDSGHGECLRILQAALPSDQQEERKDGRFLENASNTVRNVLEQLPISDGNKVRSQIEWVQRSWSVGPSRVIDGTMEDVQAALIDCFRQDIGNRGGTLQCETDTDGWRGIAHNALFRCGRGLHHVGKYEADRYIAVLHKRY